MAGIEPYFLFQDLPTQSQWIFSGFLLMMGAAVGSFLNVVALRQLADEEFVKTPSHCPKCNYRLQWYDNIPILSWLLLGAKCRNCKAPIHWQYPLVELITGLLFVAIGWQFGIGWLTLVLAAFVASLVVMTITDFREHVIFTLNAVWLMPLGIALHAVGWDNNLLTVLAWVPRWTTEASGMFDASFWSALMGVAGIFIIFEGMIWLSRKLVGQDAFGHGDTLILMAVAAFLGWEQAVATLALGGLITAIATLPIMMTTWAKAGHWSLVAKLGGALVLTAIMYGLTFITLPAMVFLPIAVVILGASVFLLMPFMREKQTVGGFTQAPFGPGLMAAAVLLLFYGQQYLPKVLEFISR